MILILLDISFAKLFQSLKIAADEQASEACQRTGHLLAVAAEFADNTEPAVVVRSCSLRGEPFRFVAVAWR